MSSKITAEPTIFIIFGGTGDLNARKLAPALYNLYLDGWMPKQFSIIGTGRTKLTDDEFRKNLLDDINQFSRSGKTTKAKWDEFSKNLYYQVSDAKDAETYKEFGKRIDAHEKEWSIKPNVMYYLAVAPEFFPIIASNISK